MAEILLQYSYIIVNDPGRAFGERQIGGFDLDPATGLLGTNVGSFSIGGAAVGGIISGNSTVIGFQDSTTISSVLLTTQDVTFEMEFTASGLVTLPPGFGQSTLTISTLSPSSPGPSFSTLTVSTLPTNVYITGSGPLGLVGAGDSAFVQSGGFVSGFEITASAIVNSSVTVESGGTLVANGGTIEYAGIASGGNEFVQAGNNLSTTVSAGGTLTISGGVDSLDSVAGQEIVYGGVASATSVLAGGELVVLAGGAVSAAGVSGDLLISGGAATAIIVSNGGGVYLDAGTDSGASVSSGGSLFVSGGIDIGAVIGSGGIAFVTGSGVITNAVVSSGGLVELQAGGRQSGTTLLAGGALDLHGASFAAAAGFAFNSATDILSYTLGGVPRAIQLAGNYTNTALQFGADSGGGILISATARS